MPNADVLVMTMITPHVGQVPAAIAALGDLISWESRQPGFDWTDVSADPGHPGNFWTAERWASRDLRDGARLDPVGAARLAKLEALLEKDDVAAYVPVDLYPHHGGTDLPASLVRSGDALPLTPGIADDAPAVQIARFHLKPGSYVAFSLPSAVTTIRSPIRR